MRCVLLLGFVSLVAGQAGSVVWSQTQTGNFDLSSTGQQMLTSGWRVTMKDARTGSTQWMMDWPTSGNGLPRFSHDDRAVFHSYYIGDTGLDYFRMSNATDGRALWEREDLHCRVRGRPTLSANGDVVFLACDNVLALNTRTGGTVWRFSTPDTFHFNTTVLLSPDGTLVYAHNRDEFFALNARTGERVWSRLLPVMYGAPAWSHDKQFVYVGAGEDLVALDAKNGRTAFTLTGTQSSRRVTTPVVSRDGRRVYFAGDRTVEAFDLPARERAWYYFVMFGQITTNIVLSTDEQHLYGGSSERGGYFWALDVHTGEQAWSDPVSRRPQGEIQVTRDWIYAPGGAMQGLVVYRQR